MESLEEGPKSKSFIKYVFSFDEDGKSEFINVIQYSLLAIIPMIILNKLMQKYVPDADEEKGSMEILAEVLIQVIIIFVSFIIINRIITFVPTYSGIKYPEHTFIFTPELGFIMLILSLQTKLGEKVNILVNRVMELWNGKSEDDKKKKKGKGNVKVTQPISQVANQAANAQAMYTDGTSINNLPMTDSMPAQQLPDYNNMYRNDNTPLVNAATPGMESFQMMSNEPMAANAALGSGAFGSW
jgi:hypothetical protein